MTDSYYNRNIDRELIAWKEDKNRKPLFSRYYSFPNEEFMGSAFLTQYFCVANAEQNTTR